MKNKTKCTVSGWLVSTLEFRDSLKKTHPFLKREAYTVNDIIQVGCMLEPIQCIHCHHVGEVAYNQYIGDGDCGMCGKWQLSEEEE